ncbi:DUF2235 domain-containing protein [Pseudosulfitobacter koreensis]|uniref:DUF2235 domain-containing protein n=1 Tax=Pseudosulfitobacter koreensis TaxID=2968472 RepID=A0ABT1YXW0_9RHOB|nr:DUF2235 domain-containing protein [Pseudosulfitobacter koreense]MCR8825715.1 DUF2235 domain-containing protein [Pseudosulfitobacter koreense]
MTRIAVFCDGTWNSPTISEPTSVHKLHLTMINDPAQGQVSAYFKGIGTDERFDGPVRKFFNKYGGGAFGWGLDAKVKQAYQFIAEAYRSGDEIYLFGFSRGAFTARSVAGMIRKCGIVTDTSTEGINAAFELYRKPGDQNHPDKRHILEARRRLSPEFATSQEDLDWRADGSEMVNIAYIGVWDTVGARGIPVSILGPVASLWNRQYKFHDMALSSLVRSARHAVAVDERRLFYRPAKWDNLDDLKDKPGLNGGDTGPDRKYQQVWFVGTHSMVGGSAKDEQALAVYPLLWIFEGARGLTQGTGIRFPHVNGDALVNSKGVVPEEGWLRNRFLRWREGPLQKWELHDSTDARWRGREDYRPRSLQKLFPG